MARISSSLTPAMVVTRTPLRVSFAGGGTDLPAFYRQQYGAVLSTAIDKYVYVTIKRHGEVFNERIRVNYYRSEEVQRVDEIDNNIVRECLRFVGVEPPIYISTISDLPVGSGLGGSSSFAVGLLSALHAYAGERMSAGQLAEEASYIEIEILKQPIGKQDQYAAAFGGLNFLCFQPEGSVTVEPVRLANGTLTHIFQHLLMFWTGHQRDSSSVLTEQNRKTPQNIEVLLKIRSFAQDLRALLNNGHLDIAGFGSVLDESWNLKRRLASNISNDEIDRWYEAAKQAGAYGGKISGAGGGGFLFFVVPPERQDAVRKALATLPEVPIGAEVHGSQILISE